VKNISLKNDKIQREANVKKKLEIEIEVLESRKAYRYSTVDENHTTEYKDGR
jgi:tRNA U34 2-thiouridine synthase MnmA/TrmU